MPFARNASEGHTRRFDGQRPFGTIQLTIYAANYNAMQLNSKINGVQKQIGAKKKVNNNQPNHHRFASQELTRM